MPATAIRSLPRSAALGLVVVILTLLVGGLFSAMQPEEEAAAGPTSSQDEGDWDLYRAISQRLRSGESYYPVLQAELRERGYPTRSVFNWRTPLHLWLVSHLPSWLCNLLLGVVALASVALSRRLWLERGGRVIAAAGGVFLAGALVPYVLGDVYLFAEVGAGALIVLSGLLLAHDRWRTAVVIGVLALFWREHALLFCVVAIAVAARRGDRRQLVWWLAGLLAWAIYFGAHAVAVSGRITEIDRAATEGWLQLGGMEFVLATSRLNVLLLISPMWVTAIYVPLALLGLVAWPAGKAWPLRLAGIAFAAAFMVVGKPVNFYWGPLYVPLLALGIVWAPAALDDLAHVALGRPPQDDPSPS